MFYQLFKKLFYHKNNCKGFYFGGLVDLSGLAEKYLQVNYYLVDSLQINQSGWADSIKDLDNVTKTLSFSCKKTKFKTDQSIFFTCFQPFLFVDFRLEITEQGEKPKAVKNTQQSMQRQKFDLDSLNQWKV